MTILRFMNNGDDFEALMQAHLSGDQSEIATAAAIWRDIQERLGRGGNLDPLEYAT